MIIPPISSTTAKAVRNIFRLKGTFLPRSERTPREKAMSVAMGMAAPRMAGPDGLISQKSRTGMIMPPQAATTGSKAFRGEESSPTSSSRLISNPTEKKKIAMRASLMKSSNVIGLPS